MVVLRHDSHSAATFHLLLSVFSAPGPGRDALLDRATEMLFILALRDVAALPDKAPRFRAVEDPHVGRALRSIHEAPAQDWTVAKLAASAGMSRSGLASRFQATLGLSPGRYLTRCTIR